jgi:hypothetical protein
MILSCRDYSGEPPGSAHVMPVQQDVDRIFLCRLEYDTDHVGVTDIHYTTDSKRGTRVSGTYSKKRIAPDLVA